MEVSSHYKKSEEKYRILVSKIGLENYTWLEIYKKFQNYKVMF